MFFISLIPTQKGGFVRTLYRAQFDFVVVNFIVMSWTRVLPSPLLRSRYFMSTVYCRTSWGSLCPVVGCKDAVWESIDLFVTETIDIA
jgi:hypothetical protein